MSRFHAEPILKDDYYEQKYRKKVPRSSKTPKIWYFVKEPPVQAISRHTLTTFPSPNQHLSRNTSIYDGIPIFTNSPVPFSFEERSFIQHVTDDSINLDNLLSNEQTASKIQIAKVSQMSMPKMHDTP